MDVKELRAEVRRMVMDLTEEECAEILKEMGCKYDHIPFSLSSRLWRRSINKN